MSANATVRDSGLIDKLEALPAEPFKEIVWRVVREGRDPLQCSAPGGRWDDGSFDVLYTSKRSDGAVAEIYFHLLRGQPVFPSKIGYRLYELRVSLAAVMTLTMDDLASLGLDAARFGQMSYDERHHEYPRSQEISETAHFLDCDGLIVPSARWDCSNLVLFCDRLGPGAMEVVKDHGIIDWTSWAEANRR